MDSPEDKVRELIADQAAEWFVANREHVPPRQRQAFVEWLQTSPTHVEEYLAHAVIARDFHQACEFSDEALDELLARARAAPDSTNTAWVRSDNSRQQIKSSAWRRAAAIATCTLAAAVGWLALRGTWPSRTVTQPESIVEIHLSTRHGEQQMRRLVDNTVLHLNTDSDVTIRYSRKERLVILNAGEAEFDVVAEPDRVFRVIAGDTRIVDVGTQFDVLRRQDKTVITVVEGQIALSSAKLLGQDEMSVSANYRATVSDGQWPPAKPVPVDARQATAWLHRQIVFNHEPLENVAAEFNRYVLKPIEIVTPRLRKLEISGVFTTDDATAFIAFLRTLENVRVDETSSAIRVSGRPL